MTEQARERGGLRARWLLPGALAALALAALALVLTGPASAAAPIASILYPVNNASFEACDVIQLNASFSSDPEGLPLYYIWSMQNETVEGPNASVVGYSNFTTPGSYDITLTVRDSEALEDNATVRVNIVPCNVLPVAVIAAPDAGRRFFTDEFINFSAAGSYDPDGTITLYQWSANGLLRSSNMTASFKLEAGVQNITLTVTDNSLKGAKSTANITIYLEVNLPPAVRAASVSPLTGFAGDAFTFSFNYSDGNGEGAVQALLVLDGAPHTLVLRAGGDPLSGQSYTLGLDLAAGRHAFYFLAFDGNLTNISATFDGPDVYENVTRLSEDGLAVFDIAALAPSTFAILHPGAALPADPAGLEAVSPGYSVNATALDGTDFALTLSFAPPAGIDGASALVMRLANNSWQPLVTDTDAAAHTAAITGEFRDLPAVFRVFARRAVVAPNEPPVLQIAHSAPSGEYYPNASVRFDASGSSDPENATLLYAWRFTGPGVATDWIPGPVVTITFPEAGLYAVELRGDDGSGSPTTKATTLEIQSRPAPVVDTLEEPLALAGLAGAVAVSALLALWWRSRTPRPKRGYDDQYGALYKQSQAMEEKEYAQLFEKFADGTGEGEPPEVIRGEE